MLIPRQFSAATEAGPQAGTAVHSLQGRTMGTAWSLRCVLPAGADPAAAMPLLQAAIQAALDRVVAQMSHWDPASELSRFNAAPAGSWHRLSDDFYSVLDAAQRLAQQTDGAYDVTAGALVNAWGFGPLPASRSPDDAELRAALQTVGWQRLQLDAANRSARQPGGLLLDLSSIAKGFGVDRMAAVLDRAGVLHYMCEIGGELRGQGCKPDGSPWWVELEAVPDARGPLQRWLLALDELSVATSGDYQRFYQRGAHRDAHTLDPRSGRPLRPAPASVSVIHRDCMQADALATALTVLGLQDGMAYAERHQIAALFQIRRRDDSALIDQHPSSALLAMLD